MGTIRKACQCPVCLQTLGLATSWPCGHSFCQSCSLIMIRDFSDLETQKVKCPTCRNEVKKARIAKLQPNLIIRELLLHVFGAEETRERETEVAKQVAKLKALELGPRAEDGPEFAGEFDGQHDVGWEVTLANDEYKLTRSGSITASRNVVRDSDRFTHRLCLVPIAPTVSTLWPSKKKHLTSWKFNIAVLEMEEDEMEDNGGFPPAVALPTTSLFIDRGGDVELIRTQFTDALMCAVSVNGNELEEIESCETQRGVATFFLGDLFADLAVEYGAQIKLKITSVEEGLSLVIRFTFSKPSSSDEPEKFLLKRQHRVTEHGQQQDGEEVDDSEEDGEDDSEEDEEDSDEEEMRRKRRRRRRNEEEEDLDDSMADFIVDSDEEDDSMTDFVVDLEEEESIKKRRRKQRVALVSDDEEEESSEEESPKQKKARKMIIALSDNDDDDDDDDNDDDDSEEEEEGDERQRYLAQYNEASSEDEL